ncbi:MAG: restriction endonuclease subunit S [Acidobacteriota bacterium]|jgi:hypothetical protein|nr:restriction endonuclease subunit S [Acidobacteriota bacterium]
MRIGDFCVIRSGHAFRGRILNVSGGNKRVIQPRNIGDEGAVFFSADEPLRVNVSGGKPLKPKDVLVVNRGRFAATVFNQEEPGSWIVPASILVLSVTSPAVLPEYVVCYINSAGGQRLFQRHIEQSTIPYISPTNLGSMDIPIPSLERQVLMVECCTAAARYAKLINRKQEIYREILDHELKREVSFVDRRVK